MDDDDNENNKEGKSYIYTDSYKTKDLIWDNYNGFTTQYGNYIMYMRLAGDCPIEVTAGLYRYATELYEEIRPFLKEFEEQLEKEKAGMVNMADKLFENSIDWKEKDYKFIRRFFSNFLTISGIRSIVKETEDPGQTIKKNR